MICFTRILISLLAISLLGCSSKYADFFPYHDDGTPKPYVVMLPIRNSAQSGLSWDVSRDLTDSIRYRLMREGKIFMPSEQTIRKVGDSIATQDLFSDQLSIATQFKPGQFAVFLDLIDHSIVPYKRGEVRPLYPASMPTDQAIVLKMKLRLKIIDLRGPKPIVVRQEIVESNHMLPKYAVAEAEGTRGMDSFHSTALGLAHARLARDIAQTIEHNTKLSLR